jgi:hypothetical protein
MVETKLSTGLYVAKPAQPKKTLSLDSLMLVENA